MVKKQYFFLLAFFVFIFDRLTKFSITSNFNLNESINIFSFLSFTRVHNFGVAWGILQGKGIISILISILVIILIAYNFEKIFKLQDYVVLAIALILGGVLGNLFDRIFFGYVIDFIDFHFWPVFNVADCALVIGAILFMTQPESEKDKAKNRKKEIWD